MQDVEVAQTLSDAEKRRVTPCSLHCPCTSSGRCLQVRQAATESTAVICTQHLHAAAGGSGGNGQRRISRRAAENSTGFSENSELGLHAAMTPKHELRNSTALSPPLQRACRRPRPAACAAPPAKTAPAPPPAALRNPSPTARSRGSASARSSSAGARCPIRPRRPPMAGRWTPRKSLQRV